MMQIVKHRQYLSKRSCIILFSMNLMKKKRCVSIWLESVSTNLWNIQSSSTLIVGGFTTWWRKGHLAFGKPPDLLFSTAQKKVYFREEGKNKAIRSKKAESAGL